MHEFLDAGHGSCLLRRVELRKIVADSFDHWDGKRCLLAGWVIMPNHVHLLIQPNAGSRVLKLCESWKRWTAARINRTAARRGPFWQGEGWDHLLRRPAYLTKFRKYMRLNPVKAHLPASDYSLWLPEIEGLEEARNLRPGRPWPATPAAFTQLPQAHSKEKCRLPPVD